MVVRTRWWCCGGAVFGRTTRGGGFRGKLTKTEPPGLGYGCAAGNGCRGRWGEVAWWCIQGSGGVVVPCLVMQMGTAGLRSQAQNRASGAWLRVRRRKRLSGEMGGGGRVVCKREWRCGGAAFGRASGLAGLGLKTETGPLVLGYGCAIRNGCGRQWRG